MPQGSAMNHSDICLTSPTSTQQGTGNCSRFLKRWFIAFALASLATGVLAEGNAGSVKASKGDAVIVRGNTSLPVTNGVEVKPGDVVRTTDNATVRLTLTDNTRVVVGPNSQVALDSYEYNPNDNKGSMLVSMLKGTMRMISGMITKANPGQALIKTGTATVGLRGTDVIIEVP
jgi:hypothetical protein